MDSNSFFWHDYETFGINPRRDRPSQFAGQRTDEELRPIGDPLVVYCRPQDDYLPEPEACLVTGITPQEADRKGLTEAGFAARIHAEFIRPGTCGVGYNSIRFDDEFSRNLFYRNFYDPYEREWKNGNSRWDLIDAVRLCHALRPQGIEWPEREPGKTSFRLEHLTAANSLDHGHAHDALSDVQATIDLARLLRDRQPRLFQWALGMRDKKKARSLLDFSRRQAVVHVSSRYPAERGCLAVVAPLCPHPTNSNGIVVLDLSADPTPLEELDAEAIHDRVFTPSADLPEGVERLPLKTVHVNKSPMLAPLGVLQNADLDRIGLDLDRCLDHEKQVQAIQGLAEKIPQVFTEGAREPRDVEDSLYDGFLPDSDKGLLSRIRSAPPDRLAEFTERFKDSRYPELLFRYRARNHPDALDPEERERWRAFCTQQLLAPQADGISRLDRILQRIELLRPDHSGDSLALLDQLEAWAREKTAGLGDGGP